MGNQQYRKGYWQEWIDSMTAGGGVFIGRPDKQILVDEDIASDLNTYYPSIRIKFSKGKGSAPQIMTTLPDQGRRALQAARVVGFLIMRREGRELLPIHEIRYVNRNDLLNLQRSNIRPFVLLDQEWTRNVNEDFERRKHAVDLGIHPEVYLRQLKYEWQASHKGGA